MKATKSEKNEKVTHFKKLKQVLKLIIKPVQKF